MPPQTYRVKLSDGREFDVTTEGGPPSEQAILASLNQQPAPDPVIGGEGVAGAEPSSVSRAVGAGVEALKGAATMTGIPGFVREGPVGAVKDQLGVVRGLLEAQFDAWRKGRDAIRSGRFSEGAGYMGAAALPVVGPMAARVGEQIANDQIPELVGETVAGAMLAGAPGAARGARRGFEARKAAKAARTGAAVEGDLMMAVPPSRSAPYTPADYRTARPYLNAQHEKTPITTVQGFKEAADGAIGEIEARVSAINEAFPEASVNPGPKVAQAVAEAFKDHPRGGALQAGLKELEDLGLNRDYTLPELDAIRAQLNAENRGVLKKNNYDQATARKVDPGFAAREAAAAAIRDAQYGYLEARGVDGVRQLRRDEGSLIKVRNAAERQTFAGQRHVSGTEGGPVRQALAALVDQTVPLPGAITKPIAGVVRGARKTRDDLIARVFSAADQRRPVYPVVPARRPVVGALPPASAPSARPTSGPVVGPSGVPVTTPIPERPALPAGRPPIVTDPPADTSGPIAPTLPQHYLDEQKFLDEVTGPKREAMDVPASERSFLLRWLADDLREIRYEGSSRLRGVHAIDEATDRAYGEKATNYRPRTAGTATQEMFKALGFNGTRAEIANQIDNYLRGSGRKGGKLEALGDALREAWDGKAFDFDLISDETIQRLGIRRKDLKSPITTPDPGDQPGVYAKFFGGDEAEAPSRYLHGTDKDFDQFQRGPHGAVYLSERKTAGKSQAEYIAEGPFGGRLLDVDVDDAKLKPFDPVNDEMARQIFEHVLPGKPVRQWIEYEDMPELVKAAEEFGYNDFKVREPSVQGFSRAITEPAALTIRGRKTVERGQR